MEQESKGLNQDIVDLLLGKYNHQQIEQKLQRINQEKESGKAKQDELLSHGCRDRKRRNKLGFNLYIQKIDNKVLIQQEAVLQGKKLLETLVKQKNERHEIKFLEYNAQQKQNYIEERNNKQFKQYLEFQWKQENEKKIQKIQRKKVYEGKSQWKQGKEIMQICSGEAEYY